MNKTTRIAGIDNKYGRKSRTGSTISMNITDVEAMECQQYLMAIEAGEEPSGRIKKIELIMYSEDDLKGDYTNKLYEMEKELERVIEVELDSNDDKIDSVLSGVETATNENGKLPANQLDLDIYEQ